MTTKQRNVWIGYIQALLAIGIATLAGIGVESLVTINAENIVMLYLLAVVVIALRFGNRAAILASGGSIIAFNFFFIEPRYTLHVAEAQYLLTFSGLFIVGLVIASLAARARQQTEAAERREQQTAALYAFTRELSATVNLDETIRSISHHLQQTLQAEIAIFLAQKNSVTVALLTEHYQLNEREWETIQWVHRQGKPAGRDKVHYPYNIGYYLPLQTVHQLGVLGIQAATVLTDEQQQLAQAFAAQAALAIDAALLAEQAQQAQLLKEKERLQSTLLNSISHDLRTPLVSITGALSSLREDSSVLNTDDRRDLLDGAYDEAQRLNRLVGNLLEMSRLQSGALRLKREPYDVQEIIGVARTQIQERSKKRPIHVQIANDVPLVSVDLVLFAQVMVNLLDNALKYSPDGSVIEIAANAIANDNVCITVCDRGIGIPEADLPNIFQKFYRSSNTGGRGGTGLGLSICDGIIAAHNGTIEIENRAGGGTCVTITVPAVKLTEEIHEQG
jgi:two-component system sensor histidine kinase KdpD